MAISRIVMCTVLIICCAIPGYAKAGKFVLSDKGVPKAAIVLSPDAVEAEQTAAAELARHLKWMTDADYTIHKSGTAPENISKIYIGQSEKTKSLLGNIDWNSLKYDGIVIKFVGNDLVLAGDRPRGSLYAVYTFLEEYLGCRWWTAKATYTPFSTTLSVDKKDKTHIPSFMYRETYYQPVNHKNLAFASRMRLNGSHQSVPDYYGGHYTLIGFVHTFDKFLPASKYLDAHPEWYSLVNGKRVGGQDKGQLCLTNEEMKKEFIKITLEEIAKDPAAGMIAIDQNDNQNFCRCDNCMAVAEEEGGQAGLLIRFVNDVADAVAEKYPEFWVETLAYQYTRHAPKLARPRDNVIVRLCSIECDFASPLDSKNNESFYKDLQDWKKMSKRLYIWDYVVDFANLVIGHPNWRVLEPNLKIFAENNVVGMFEQGDGFNPDAAFGNMKIYVMSHLMWDHSMNAYELMKDFAEGYYGPAGKYMIDYLDLTCDAVERSNMYLGCFVGANLDYLGQADMNKANDLFDKAEAAVKNNPTLLNRVKIERLALDHTWLLHTTIDRSKAGRARGMNLPEIAEDFITRSKATGNIFIGESSRMTEEYYDTLRSLATVHPLPAAKKKATMPEAVKGLNRQDWVEVQDAKMSLYKPGIISFIEGDEEASDGRAIRMLGQYPDWATQVHLDRTGFEPGTKVTIYASVKANLKAKTGIAFSTGVYDTLNAERILDWDVKVDEVKGEGYQEYRLGTYTLKPGWYVYVAPPGDAKQAEDVLVDRIFVIKER